MGVAEMLGKNGIFISDQARGQLNIKLSEDEFKALKEQVNKDHDPDEIKKCFLTGQMVSAKDGLMIDSNWMADAIQKNIESQEKLWNKFKKDKVVVCESCGTQNDATDNTITCHKCNKEINVKQYKKNIKLPYAKKLSMRLYIKYLRGKTKL